jgi:hypothetical protein
MASDAPEPSRDSYTSLLRLRHDKPDERVALEALLVTQVRAAEERAWPYAMQWFDNACFLTGNHMARNRWSKGLGFTHYSFAGDGPGDMNVAAARSAANMLIRPYERIVSMFCKGKPAPRITPASDTPNEKLAAKTAAALLELLLEHPLEFSVLRRQIAATAALMGTSIVETGFEESEDPVEVPKLRRVQRKNRKADKLFAEEGKPAPEEEWEQDGDKTEGVMRPELFARVWTPLHVSPDPAATNDREVIWYRRGSFQDMDSLWERYERTDPGYYREKLKGMAPSNGTESPLYYWGRIQEIVDSPQDWNVGFSSGWDRSTLAPNHAAVHIFDCKPSLRFPRGRTMVLAGGQLVYCSDEARAWIAPDPRRGYVGRWHEYVAWRWFELTGRWLGVAPVSLLVPQQRKVNAIDAATQVNRESMAFGQWLVPDNCGVPDGFMSGRPMLHIPYKDRPGMKGPERVKNDQLPTDVWNERGLCEKAIDGISSTGVVDPGIAPSGARAGVMLQFVKAEQMAGKEPAVQAYERCLEKVGQNALLDAQRAGIDGEPWMLERIKLAAPQQSQLAVEAFLKSSMLDHYSVKLDIASEILTSPEAKVEKATAAGQYFGATLQPDERRQLMEAMGLGDVIKAPENVARDRAEMLLGWILEGNMEAVFLMPGIDKYDVILTVFWEFMMTPRFQEMPEEQSKMVLGIWEQCMAEMQKQMAAQQAAMAQQQATEGAPKKEQAA